MKRGTKPQPTALKLLRGERRDRVNRNEPVPGPGIPDCPEHLDADARAEWDRIAPELAKMGVLTLVDRAALALYCALYGRWVQAERKIQEVGMVTDTARGGLQVSPYVQIARDCAAECKRLAAEFGATPSSRSRLKSQVEPPQDELAVFLSKRRGS